MQEEAYIERAGLEKVIGVLLSRLDGYAKITQEQLEDAPDVEIRKLFETEEIEMRTDKTERKTLFQHVNNHESWNG